MVIELLGKRKESEITKLEKMVDDLRSAWVIASLDREYEQAQRLRNEMLACETRISELRPLMPELV